MRKVELMSAAAVRAVIEKEKLDGETFTAAAERLARELGISRRILFDYLKDGVTMKVRDSARKFVEYVEKQK